MAKLNKAEAENVAASLREARPLGLQHNLRMRGAINDRQPFQQALDLTRDIPIAEMHRLERATLNKSLHERPQLLATSNRFHYVRLALLFGVPSEETRVMENAEDVLNHISQTQEVEMTVAEFLSKLEESGQCYDVVRRLCKQIIKRDGEQH